MRTSSTGAESRAGWFGPGDRGRWAVCGLALAAWLRLMGATPPVVQWESPDLFDEFCGCATLVSPTLRMNVSAHQGAGAIAMVRIRRGAVPVYTQEFPAATNRVDLEVEIGGFSEGPTPVYVEAVDDQGLVGRSVFRMVDKMTAREMVAEDAEWRYLETAVEPPANWTAADFDDSHWKTGRAPFGSGLGIGTVLDGSPDDSNPVPRYFRIKMARPQFVATYRLRVSAEGGVAFHVNGEEFRRFNLPAGRLSAATRGLAASSMTSPTDYTESVPGIRGDIAYPLPFMELPTNQLAVALYAPTRAAFPPWFGMEFSAINRSVDCNCPFRLTPKVSMSRDGDAVRLDTYGQELFVAGSPAGPWIPYKESDSQDPVIYLKPTGSPRFFSTNRRFDRQP